MVGREAVCYSLPTIQARLARLSFGSKLSSPGTEITGPGAPRPPPGQAPAESWQKEGPHCSRAACLQARGSAQGVSGPTVSQGRTAQTQKVLPYYRPFFGGHKAT